ncbi:bifunctional serine/threonine-protein kinase/formylglycine-generating enzyme family protein [Dokdonella fugitiva]|uniref:bifunctional serine/threonine-protein kinase/formylglycine-generating enzyme family protein n=1 Tax=Dokdonella fugitiva TaxID=328517 RepID=UPI0015FC8766|nr:bifunctional serine/threonine-protein kinase/formylglycine-generating enzyme family protein [Dokdonella fugitiva]MBA8885520.1 formylglycine-generating enzyme required for sulfatase activity [Dokdonella fugitiva]
MTYLKQPFTIPGYRLIGRLGVGGMATVYLASQESLSRLVAIKVLANDHSGDELVRRFENEARTIARLDHPHIVQIHDVGRTSTGQIYYTMPYLSNGDLSTRNIRNDPERILAVMRALVEALGCAHDHGIVHRDVKPENVLFDKLDRPMLADFGIALTGSKQQRVTREGATIGSSGYMSPEQARGQPIDGRSDFYSLGVLCYELLTGEMPFQGGDALAVALAHIEKPVPRLPVTRRIWQPLIDKALAKHPDARFQSAEEMLAALDIVARRMRATTPSGLGRRSKALVERIVAIPRRRRALALGGLMAATLVALVALSPHVAQRTALHAGGAAGTPAAVAARDADPLAGARAQHLQQADDLMSINRLVEPAGASAADEYLAVLAAEPQQDDARKGLARIFERLGAQARQAIADDHATEATHAIDQADGLASRAGAVVAEAHAAFAKAVHDAVEQRRARTRDPLDPSALHALEPLLPALARVDAAQAKAIEAALAQSKARLRVGAVIRDDGGPEMVVMPATRGSTPSIAMSVDEVTRGAYAAFARAAGRPVARCRASQNLIALVASRGIDWRHPGFEQGDDHPVVCVSWADANAYARWLGERTGARYRLPSSNEWLAAARAAGSGKGCRAANIEARRGCNDGYEHTAPVGRFGTSAPGLHDLAGNVSEWVDVCANRGRGGEDCGEHRFRGLSWRDDDEESNLDRIDSAPADVGYANVGIRLVRELPAVDAAQ